MSTAKWDYFIFSYRHECIYQKHLVSFPVLCSFGKEFPLEYLFFSLWYLEYPIEILNTLDTNFKLKNNHRHLFCSGLLLSFNSVGVTMKKAVIMFCKCAHIVVGICAYLCVWQNMFSCVQMFQEARSLSQMSHLGRCPYGCLTQATLRSWNILISLG